MAKSKFETPRGAAPPPRSSFDIEQFLSAMCARGAAEHTRSCGLATWINIGQSRTIVLIQSVDTRSAPLPSLAISACDAVHILTWEIAAQVALRDRDPDACASRARCGWRAMGVAKGRGARSWSTAGKRARPRRARGLHTNGAPRVSPALRSSPGRSRACVLQAPHPWRTPSARSSRRADAAAPPTTRRRGPGFPSSGTSATRGSSSSCASAPASRRSVSCTRAARSSSGFLRSQKSRRTPRLAGNSRSWEARSRVLQDWWRSDCARRC
jgi:hypothetical protein